MGVEVFGEEAEEEGDVGEGFGLFGVVESARPCVAWGVGEGEGGEGG